MKRKTRLNKKAVSPLIAAVLLMVLTVVVGALIMNWVNRYVKEQVGSAEEKSSTEITCGQDVVFNFLEVDSQALFCNSSATNFSFTIENGRNKDIDGFKIRAININNEVCDLEDGTQISAAGAKKITVDFSATTCLSPKSIKIFPKVKTKNVATPVVCTDNYLDVSNWETCT